MLSIGHSEATNGKRCLFLFSRLMAAKALLLLIRWVGYGVVCGALQPFRKLALGHEILHRGGDRLVFAHSYR